MNIDKLMYWIEERERIRIKKEAGQPKPWTDDPVFQRTYFCNVRREHDKVTWWIRNYYSEYIDHPMFEYNMILARFLNWPDTLRNIGFYGEHDPHKLEFVLGELAEKGKIWGNAYVITTHGMKMPKAHYLAYHVLEGTYQARRELQSACRGIGTPTCQIAYAALLRLEGLGSFLAAQVVADLKNTEGHPLRKADDWLTFVAPGPGSIKGASWFHYGGIGGVTASTFWPHFKLIRRAVNERWPDDMAPICNQDLQNCLCEFDKYCRVSSGTGRSKRGYNGG